MDVDRHNEEYATNLLLGALKFLPHDRVLRPVWSRIVEANQQVNGNFDLGKALAKPALWKKAEFRIQPNLVLPAQKVFGKKGEASRRTQA